MQPEHAVDRLDLRRLDQLGMRDGHRDQRPFQLVLPERQEILQRRKFREQVVVLPDVGLQQPEVRLPQATLELLLAALAATQATPEQAVAKGCRK